MSPVRSTLERTIATAMDGDADDAAAQWAHSGAMALTGLADGPALVGPARVALAATALGQRIHARTAELGAAVELDTPALLGERAAIAGFGRQGSTSCGGHCRLLPAVGGWIALSLARPSDLDLLDAWLGGAVVGIPTGDPPTSASMWSWVAAAVRDRRAGELAEQATLLGLPCARVHEVDASARPLVVARSPGTLGVRSLADTTVVDLSSLWAGPLCAHVLGLGGARVIKVESSGRPDGARFGPPAFFDLLHAGHASVALDLAEEPGQAALRRLLRRADVVIEASRPRALRAMGASHEHLMAEGWSGIWVSITGYGRDDRDALRVAFGDDAAAAGGLVVQADDERTFCGDAIADPVTGLVAAAAVLDALAAGVSGGYDLALATTAAHLAAGIRRSGEVVAAVDAAPPSARAARGKAASLGADTDAVLGET